MVTIEHSWRDMITFVRILGGNYLMKRKWTAILFIVTCFITGSIIPVYAVENKNNDSNGLSNYTVVSEKTAQNLSSSLIYSVTENEAFKQVKTDILNKEIEKEEKEKIEKAKEKEQTMMMEATAYSCNEGFIGGGNLTAMGQDLYVDPMAIAVDPSVIPLGTKLYVEGYGEAIASDTGGAIKGNIIDLHFSDVSQCINWGRRQVSVTILG